MDHTVGAAVLECCGCGGAMQWSHGRLDRLAIGLVLVGRTSS